jgi:hypothetical protein
MGCSFRGKSLGPNPIGVHNGVCESEDVGKRWPRHISEGIPFISRVIVRV